MLSGLQTADAGTSNMVLIPVLVLLFASWMLWGWIVADHRNIAWMRKWCAILFTVTAIFISAGAGIFTTLTFCRREQRIQIRELATDIEQKLSQGQVDAALKQVREIVQRPGEWSDQSPDILDRVEVVTKKQKASPQGTASKTQAVSPSLSESTETSSPNLKTRDAASRQRTVPESVRNARQSDAEPAPESIPTRSERSDRSDRSERPSPITDRRSTENRQQITSGPFAPDPNRRLASEEILQLRVQ
jgi:hypothetical protein